LVKNICLINSDYNKKIQKLKNYKRILFLVLIILTILFIGAGIYSQSLPRRLYPGEILEYDGENLSSINDFRENSIRGPQRINLSSYILVIKGLVNRTIEYSYDEIVSDFQKYQKNNFALCRGLVSKNSMGRFLIR
jgi:amino acid permease